MTASPWRLATVDIDGTLTTIPGWLAIARQFGKEEEYRALIRRQRAGEVTQDEAVAGLLSFAEGHTLAEVVAVVVRTPRLEHIPEGVDRLHGQEVKVALLTHNPPYVTEWYRRFAGFDGAAGLGGRIPVGTVIGRGEGIHADKVGGLASLCREFGARPNEVVHVGDSMADVEVFRRVGLGIALNPSRPEVAQAADRVLMTSDFEVVVDSILEGPPPG
jgi:phosphoserine phosphatase